MNAARLVKVASACVVLAACSGKVSPEGGAGGKPSMSGTAGKPGLTGTGGAEGGQGGSEATDGGSGAEAGMAGAAGAAASPPDLTLVRPTAGCGRSAPADLVARQFVQRTIETSGQRESSSDVWSFTRKYSVRLPGGYDPEKAYPLVLQATWCGDDDPSYALPGIAEQVINVGVFASADYASEHSSEFVNCYDIQSGDDSIELPFYEDVWEKLASELCFDQNRVFVTGAPTDASNWANEIACVYSGHAKYPVRAMGAGMGGLPLAGGPTCSHAPRAGIWLDNVNQGGYWDLSKEGIKTAREVNGCPSYEGTYAYPIPGVAEGKTCLSYVGCPASHPLVVCGFGNVNTDSGYDVPTLVDPALAYFFSSFFAP